MSEVKRQNESGHFESELKVYRAVEVERKKWEAREEQILRLKTFATGSGDAIATPVLRANAGRIHAAILRDTRKRKVVSL